MHAHLPLLNQYYCLYYSRHKNKYYLRQSKTPCSDFGCQPFLYYIDDYITQRQTYSTSPTFPPLFVKTEDSNRNQSTLAWLPTTHKTDASLSCSEHGRTTGLIERAFQRKKTGLAHKRNRIGWNRLLRNWRELRKRNYYPRWDLEDTALIRARADTQEKHMNWEQKHYWKWHVWL